LESNTTKDLEVTNNRGKKNFHVFILASYERDRIKRKERKGKGKTNGQKVTFVGLEPTPSAIWADVLSQLD
jgi:hypothetical protein